MDKTKLLEWKGAGWRVRHEGFPRRIEIQPSTNGA